MSSAHNLSVDDCLSVAGVVKADTIIEQTADAGVTIEGVLLKDGAVSDTASSFIERSVLLYAQPTSVDARVLWDMAVNSDGADMSISVANDIVTILREGMYSITASVVFDTQAGGIRRIRVNKNGTTAADGIGESVVEAFATEDMALNVGTASHFAVNDTISVYVFQNSGSNVDLLATSHLAIARI